MANPTWVEPFLETLADTHNVRLSAKTAGVSANTAYARRRRHPDFAAKWDKVVAKPKWMRKFLKALATVGVVRTSCNEAGVDRKTVYTWRQKDEEFAEKWAEALQLSADTLETQLFKHATIGWDEPVYYKGEVVGHIKRYDHRLGMWMMKHLRPEKFNDRIQIQHSVPDEVKITFGGPEQAEAESG